MRSTRGGNGKPLQYACCESPRYTMKRQKDMTSEDEPPRTEGLQNATEEEQRAIIHHSRKNEATGLKWLCRSKNDTQLWMYLVLKVKLDAI